MNDKQLIQDIQKGNEAAFKVLVERYQLLVINTCYGLVHDYQHAEDIAQEVFIEVFRSVHKFRGDAKISTWMYRIAVNRSLNFNRDNRRNRFFQSLGRDLFGTESNEIPSQSIADRPDLSTENNQRRKNLYKAIDSLPERQRVAFSLSKLDDLSYKEIAEVMDLSLSSVESLIHRAKLNLQKKLYACYKKGLY